MKPILPVVMLAPLLAAACVPESTAPEPAAPPAIADDSCGASRYLPLIGQTGPTISVPANTPYRSYKTGDPVTMDYNPARLNFEHDKTGKLVRVSCG
ncbi:I78 family peptidase inhibitor [Paracoccus sp. TOH]|uniref:I78 family peptidase inhibitor n=1 Tax=Paracoccus simplex TaxID=2086346 RepID=A0ABV7RX21_9RHOB|nr:I78 family peptidase inhibitor [Paracoccus sp. TOH]WJS85736.1 I78 family peptidase inhibitor [Paracoccus sp. TOH]